MNGHDEDVELEALQRRLDDAFATTRPRPAYEDELWLRIQSARPAPRRLADAWSGFWQGVREGPAVPAAAVAGLLIVVIGVGIVALNGLPHSGGTGSTTGSGGNNAQAPAGGQYLAGTFGRIPSPALGNAPKGVSPVSGSASGSSPDNYAPLQATWTGKFDLSITSAPVFRYREPSTADADQFASAAGAVLRDRPSGFLGMYSASDYTLKVRGTVQSPPSSPAYFIFSSLTMPAIDAAGATQKDLADIFLAQHSLQPQWSYTVSIDSSSDPVKVFYERQFSVPGYGPGYLVGTDGSRMGLEVDLSSNRPVLVKGPLPIAVDIADYRIVSAADAIQMAVSSAQTAPLSSGTPAPGLQLNQAELVYVLVPAGDHSFYEPAFMFTGTYQAGGKSYTRHVLVPAVDPSQRTP